MPTIKRISTFAYGCLAYAAFLCCFLYAIGFLGNFGVPKTIDGVSEASLGMALLVNLGLLTVFALQHSVMARPAFKRWWTQFVPQPAERSTYVLFSSLALFLVFWQWQPMGGVIWNVEHPTGRAVLYGLYAGGWLTVLVTTFLINHFDLFGLRQVWLYMRGQEYTSLKFATPGPYKHVRHPLYVGWLTVFWATPIMTFAHLVFALTTTAYILVAIQFEERDLVDFHGADYADYRRRVPMLIPRLFGPRSAEEETVPATKITSA
jgi:methanethiol S-methyltransferase